MRSYNLFTRFFIAVVFTTITSLAVAGFSMKQAFESDPDIVAKLEDKFAVQIHSSGMGFSISNRNSGTSAQDQWELTVPTKKIVIKTFSGDIAIKTTQDKKIRVIATGKLDTEKSSKLLEVNETVGELALAEPENAVKDLEIRMEIPASFIQDLEILSVSGNISAENLKLNSADLKTVSGEITLNKLSALSLKVETVSGDSKVGSSSLKVVHGQSVSGEIEIENSESAEANLNSISGDIKLKVPKLATFEFKLNTVSGDIKNAHAKSTVSDKSMAKVNIEVSTTSGDIIIEN